jgi:hypothetical protein
MRPFALLLLAVSADAAPSCERCRARDYKVEVTFVNRSSLEIVRVRIYHLRPEEQPGWSLAPGERSPAVVLPFQSFEKAYLEYDLLVSPPFRTADGRRIVMPADGPPPIEPEKNAVLVIEITDADLRTKCTGMSQDWYYKGSEFPGFEITPWDDVPCP